MPLDDDVLKAVATEFDGLLKRLGHDLGDKADEVAQYAAERSDHLANIVGEAGYEQAVEAEIQNLALKAGIAATDAADKVDQAKMQALGTGLRFAASFLSTLV